ncbi:MAG: hypothetical protein D6785_05310, partial [Planctomycetota bacterium]
MAKKISIKNSKMLFHFSLSVFSIAIFLLVSSCGDKITVNPQGDSSRFNFGAAVYQLSRNYLSTHPPYSQEKVQALDSHRDSFIDSINTTLPEEVYQDAAAPLKIIYPLVDDNTLPQASQDLKKILNLLLSHPQDPRGETLNSLAALANGKGLTIRDWTTLIGRIADYKDMESFIQALSKFVQENDGVDSEGNPNGEKDVVRQLLSFLSRKLKEMKPTPSTAVTTGSSTTSSSLDLAKELLSPVQIRGSLGEPAYSVKLDANGNPAPQINPVTGKVVYPFVDKDNDGVADTNQYGQPIDQNGNVIEIPPFGKKGNRNQQGLALGAAGTPLYQYFDAKKTLLGILVQMAGVAMKKELPSHGLQVLKAVMGQAQIHDNGTPNDPKDDYSTFSKDNPLSDFVYGLLELAKDPAFPKLIKAF